MAIIKKLLGQWGLRQAYPVINDNIENLNNELLHHSQRIDNIASQSGDDITEIKDARLSVTGSLFPTLKGRLDSSDVRLTQKAEQVFVVTELNKKRDNITKIEPEDMSQRTLELLTGEGTINLESIPQNNSVTKEKIRDGEVVLNKTTVDIFPRTIDDWAVVTYNFTVGEEAVYPRNSYKSDGINYRHDTSMLIKVIPGATLVFSGITASAYQVQVWEFDIDKLGIKTNAYQTSSSLTLSSTTEYVRLLCTTKDYTPATLEDMLANSNITVEMALNDYSKISNYSTTNKKLETLKENHNLISLHNDFWEQGTLIVGADSTVQTSPTSTRIRVKMSSYIGGITGKRKLYYSIPDGYKMGFIFADDNNKVTGNKDFIEGSGFIYVPDNTTRLFNAFAHVGDGVITPNIMQDLQVVISFSEIDFVFSHKDQMKKNEEISKIASKVEMNIGLRDKIRYVAHSGGTLYAPENTIEAYRMAEYMGAWGAEVDVMITSDNKLVLMHDETVDRTTDGTGYVRDMTLAQIRDLNVDLNLRTFTDVKVPTFEEYLDVCKLVGLYPIIEIKSYAHSYAVVDAMLPILKNYGIEKDCIIVSFGYNVLSYIREKNKNIGLGYVLPQGTTISQTIINNALALGNCTLNVYAVNGPTNLTKAMVQSCHAAGVTIMAWTIDNKETAEYLRSIGVDMIATNALLDPLRNKKVISATFSTLDNGETWTNTGNALREQVTVTKVDDYKIEIDFGGFHSKAINNFQALGVVNNITNSNIGIIPQAYREGGKIGVRFFVNGVLKALSELPSYMHLYCEVVF